MALIPLLNELLLDDTYSRRHHPVDVYDQNFGLGLDDLFYPPTSRALLNIPALRSGYLRPWRNLAIGESGVSSIKADDKEFSVRLDVTHFKPEELSVKLDDEGYIVVEGKHEERSDNHGFISRQFTRRYKLPEDAQADTLTSNLSTDGVLTLQAEMKPRETKAGREIKINRTNKPAVKEHGEKKDEQPKKEGKK